MRLLRPRPSQPVTAKFDRAFTSFMREIQAWHIWSENEIKRDCKLQKIPHREVR